MDMVDVEREKRLVSRFQYFPNLVLVKKLRQKNEYNNLVFEFI